jgi:hypothetical protein
VQALDTEVLGDEPVLGDHVVGGRPGATNISIDADVPLYMWGTARRCPSRR